MKLKSTLLFFFLTVTVFSFGQGDSSLLAKDDAKYERRVEYLNTHWQAVTDSNDATYFRYTNYDNKFNIYRLGVIKKSWRVEFTGNGSQPQNKMKLLDGEYKWMDKKGRVTAIYLFSNGEIVWCKYFYKTGVLQEYHDYTKHFKGQLHSYYIEIYDEKGNIQKYYMMKGTLGWAAYRQ